MKCKKLTALLLSLTLTASLLTVPAFAYEIRTWRDYFGMDDTAGLTHDELVEKDSYAKDHKWEMLFNSGSQGSAESTGICGGVYLTNAPDEAGRAEDFDPYLPAGSTNKDIMHYTGGVSDAVTWTLKNGVLTFSGVGPITKGFKGNNQVNPFYQNEHVKVVIFEEGITDIQNIVLDELPNLETVIVMSNKTPSRYTVDARTCPSLKTIISGADLKSGKAVDYITQGDYQNFTAIAFGSTADGHDGYANDGVGMSGNKIRAYHTKAELITMAKNALTNVPAEVLAKLPAELGGGTTPAKPDPKPSGAFTDVAATSPFYDAIQWAVKEGITTGKTATSFAPAENCTNGHILTFLWRAVGKPEPSVANPFADVSADAYYYKAALWAYEQGLISGGTFSATTPCTRSQTVTYLWKLAGSPAAGATAFTDVAPDADYAQAVSWAVEQGITTGNSATTFGPNNTCTRGQIVTFLYRDFV